MAQRVETSERYRVRARPRLVVDAGPTLRDARRDRNRKTAEYLRELRCECAQPDCRATFPAAAARHRKRLDCFIVTPDHLADETVLAAADRYFVVEE